jgi:hypothetical protein
MYPQRDLIRLEAYKAALVRDIALSRAQCAGAATRVAQPLELLDRILAVWRQLKPLTYFAVAPLGLILVRTIFPKHKTLGLLLRWGPLLFAASRGIRSLVTSHSQHSNSSSVA